MSNTRHAEFSDAAKRISDTYNLHRTANPDSVGKWFAANLSDGRSNGDLYDTKRDAVRHQLDEFLCVYICIRPTSMSPKEAAAFLSFNRKAYDSGMRMPDPDARSGGVDFIRRVTREQQREQFRALLQRRLPREPG